jgi:hypothetical protein
MPDQTPLIPLFVPPLATVLAHAEQKKGAPLTQPEVEAIRDKSACIMMEPADAQKMGQSRGFIDVNPQNCWADWHRLRAQLTGGYLPRIVLCIPGDDNLRRNCQPILNAENVEHEFQPRDPTLLRAFKSSSMTWPCFTEEDFSRIDRHTTVLYALSSNFAAADAPMIGRRFLSVGRRLLDAGGIAIKCESSGVSHSKARWTQFDDTADRSPAAKWSALFHAYVVLPIASEADFYTCGMHLLGAADLIVSQDAIRMLQPTGGSIVSDAIDLFRTFAMYLVSECPVGKFASGHTFSTARDAPRYRVLWESCDAFAEDSFFFNPFGRWRFTKP